MTISIIMIKAAAASIAPITILPLSYVKHKKHYFLFGTGGSSGTEDTAAP